VSKQDTSVSYAVCQTGPIHCRCREPSGGERCPGLARPSRAVWGGMLCQARMRMLGNIQFIGQLFKKGMLTEKIMHECIVRLLGEVGDALLCPPPSGCQGLCRGVPLIEGKQEQERCCNGAYGTLHLQPADALGTIE
jgi:MIF4G domain